jgi:serine O-acetyltransferase
MERDSAAKEGVLRNILEEQRSAPPAPASVHVREWIDDWLALLFPQRVVEAAEGIDGLRERWDACNERLKGIIEALGESAPASPAALVAEFCDEVPRLRDLLLEDADAIYEGDPAAYDHHEVIRTYPGFLAIAIYRVAHHFCRRGVPVIPRILTEYAHSRTGIDIHPAARIGPRFCIDHGTGIVIGETSEIGRNVKLYQGVTLGALSVAKEMARTKRHPTVEDDVVIYANTTILGGATVVGRGSVVGGNVWLLRSVPPGSRVHYAPGTVVHDPETE